MGRDLVSTRLRSPLRRRWSVGASRKLSGVTGGGGGGRVNGKPARFSPAPTKAELRDWLMTPDGGGGSEGRWTPLVDVMDLVLAKALAC